MDGAGKCVSKRSFRRKKKIHLDFVYKKFLWLRKKGNITRKYEYHDEADLIVLKVQVASQL